MINPSGRFELGDLILEDICAICGGKVGDWWKRVSNFSANVAGIGLTVIDNNEQPRRRRESPASSISVIPILSIEIDSKRPHCNAPPQREDTASHDKISCHARG